MSSPGDHTRIFDQLDFPGTNDTERINATLGYIRTNFDGSGVLRLNKRMIYTHDTLDATGMSGIAIEGPGGACGSFIYANDLPESRPVIDLTGSSAWRMEGVGVGWQINEASGPRPNVGFLVAGSTARSSNKGVMRDCGSAGHFSVSPLYVYGASNHAFYSCGFQQNQPGGPAMHLTRDNVAGVQSAYLPLSAPGAQSTSDLSFYSFEAHTNNDGTERTAISIRGVSNVAFTDGIIDAYAAKSSHVSLTNRPNGVSFRGVRFYKDQPGTVAEHAIVVNDIVDGLRIDQCLIQGGIANLIYGKPGAILNGPAITGDLRAYGFSGKVVKSAGSGAQRTKLNYALIQACGLVVDADYGDDSLVIHPG